jgi:hypothetical protein
MHTVNMQTYVSAFYEHMPRRSANLTIYSESKHTCVMSGVVVLINKKTHSDLNIDNGFIRGKKCRIFGSGISLYNLTKEGSMVKLAN